jgi:hypothetical protein
MEIDTSYASWTINCIIGFTLFFLVMGILTNQDPETIKDMILRFWRGYAYGTMGLILGKSISLYLFGKDRK